MTVGSIILCLLGIAGIIFGIARGIMCVKKDRYTEQENETLKALNESLQKTKETLEEETHLLFQHNRESRQRYEENLTKEKSLIEQINWLTHSVNENTILLKVQEEQKAGLEAQISTLSSSQEEILNHLKEGVRAAFESYCDILDFEYKEKEREFDAETKTLDNLYDEQQDIFLQTMARYDGDLVRRRAEVEDEVSRTRSQLVAELDGVRGDLDKIKASRAAAIEAQLREQEIKERATFYTLQLNEADLRDVAYLHSIEFNLREARPLRMLIWTTFYRDRFNDLATRVGAAGACGIYKITHIDSGISYIGQARDIKTRWSDHIKHSLGIDTPVTSQLYAFTREKGIENFTFEILEKCSASELNEKEKFYIDLYQTYEFGLNGNKGVGK